MPVKMPRMVYAMLLVLLYLTTILALLAFSIQTSKSGKIMISDSISESSKSKLFQQMGLVSSYIILVTLSVINVCIAADLENTCLLYLAFFVIPIFAFCFECDINGSNTDILCHNISCSLGGAVYGVIFLYMHYIIQKSVPTNILYRMIGYVGLMLLTGFSVILFVSIDKNMDASIGVLEMILLLFVLVFETVSVYFVAQDGYTNIPPNY